MTSYITITDAETDPEAPLTSELAKKWRDNPIAIAENDATVPVALRPYTLLATLATTSGTAWTASGLALTPFNFLVIYVDGLSVTIGTSEPLRLNPGSGAFSFATTANFVGGNLFALRMVHLDSGMFIHGAESNTTFTNTQNTGISRATTSITFDVSPLRTGDAGSIKLYGVK